MLNQKKIILTCIIVFVFVIGFALGWFVHQPKKESSSIYATWGNQTVLASDILPSIQSDLDQLEKNKYQIKKKATENFIQQKLSQKKITESVGKPPTAPTQSISDFKNIELSPAEIDSFLKARNLDRKKMSSLDMQNVINNLKLQKLLQAEKVSNQTLLLGSDIHFKIPLPEESLIKIDSGRFPAFGSSTAKVKIILVSNFNCPQCLAAEKKLNLIKDKYKDNLQVSYRFLISEPDQSVPRALAEAAYCADDQKKFWNFHDLVVAENTSISKPVFLALADKLNLDAKEFDHCLQSRKHQQDLGQDMLDLAQTPKIQAPSFIINGHLRSANEPLEEIMLVIDQYL